LRFSSAPQPFHLLHPESSRPLLLVCDHASHAVPSELEGLGLSEAEITRHIGWDIGAAEVAAEMSRLMGATTILAGVSRLVIDCNREPGHPTSICPSSDGTVIPGNAALSGAEIRAREDHWYHPYQRAIGHQLERLEQGGGRAALIAIHSFTPCMNGGCGRPWPVGVLWNQDGRLALPLMAGLRAKGLLCGDNEPYSGRIANHTVDRHGQDAGRLHVSVEIRQDEIADQTGAVRWAELLAGVLETALAEA
jgi:predicted N-formylglutamate amidohydrolase